MTTCMNYLLYYNRLTHFQETPLQQKNDKLNTDTSVTATLLDSAPVTISVPPELEVDDSAFIQYVTQEALTLHKQQIRDIDPGCVSGRAPN